MCVIAQYGPVRESGGDFHSAMFLSEVIRFIRLYFSLESLSPLYHPVGVILR